MALSPADLQALLARTNDTNWLEGLAATPDGQAVLSALEAIGAQLSRSVEDGCNAATISQAPGGRVGNSSITLVRSSFANAATVPAGYMFLTPDGVQLITPVAMTVPAGTATFTLPLQTVRQTEAVNLLAQDPFAVGTTGSAASDPGSPVVHDAAYPGGAWTTVLGPPGTTVTTAVSACAEITGATADWLSVLGNERGQQRQASETDEQYRLRVRNIPDVVSPKALAIAVNGVGDRVGMTPVYLLEPVNSGESAPLKATYFMGVLPTAFLMDGYAPPAITDFCDDPAHLLWSSREATAYFELDVPGTIGTAGNMQFYGGPGGPGRSLIDLPPGTDPPPLGIGGFLDDSVLGFLDVGLDPTLSAAFLSIWEEANRKRAGGVQFDLVWKPWHQAFGRGTWAGPGFSPVASVVAPLGTYWYLVDGELGGDANALPFPITWNSATDAFFARFTYEDTTTFDTAIYSGPDQLQLNPEAPAMAGFRWGEPITQVDLYLRSDGVNLVGVAGLFRVVDLSV